MTFSEKFVKTRFRVGVQLSDGICDVTKINSDIPSEMKEFLAVTFSCDEMHENFQRKRQVKFSLTVLL